MEGSIQEGQAELQQVHQRIIKSVDGMVQSWKKYFPSGKNIKFAYTDRPFLTGADAQVVRGWDEGEDEAEIIISLPQDAAKARDLERYLEFMAVHEICHLFSGAFEDCHGRLTEDEIRESYDINPIIESGQSEAITDIIAFRLAGDSSESFRRVAESYRRTVERYLCDPELFLRDDLRFRVLSEYVSGKISPDEKERWKDIIAQLDERVKRGEEAADRKDKRFIPRYRKYLESLTKYFDENFPDTEAVEKQIRASCQRM